MRFNQTKITLLVLILAATSLGAAPLPPRHSTKQARSTVIDGQEFISVRDLAKHLGAESEILDGSASIHFKKGELSIAVGSLCMALRDGEAIRVAQFNHPAIQIGNDIFIPKKSALEAVSRIQSFSNTNSENSANNDNQNHLIINDLNEDAPRMEHPAHGEYFTPAVNDIDRRPVGDGTELEPSVKKDIKNLDGKTEIYRAELDQIINEVGKLKSSGDEKPADNDEPFDKIFESADESTIEFIEDGHSKGEKIIDLSEPAEPTIGHKNSHQEDLIAPKVDEVKSLFKRGIRAINSLKMSTPDREEEPHTSESNPQFIGDAEPRETDANKSQQEKFEEKPQPPNVYKLPTNLLRKNIKK